MLRKLICLLLAMMLLAGVASAEEFAVNESTIQEKMLMGTTISRVTEEPVTLTVWVDISNQDAVGKLIEKMEDNDVFKIMEEKTGVHLSFIHPPIGEAETNFSLMMARRQYADIIIWFDSYYSTGGEGAIDDGVIIDLKDYVEAYAPHYMEVMNASEFRHKSMYTDSGKMPYICSPIYQDEADVTWGGPIIRKDLLDKLEMDVPVTFDDWHTFLSRCRNELGLTRAFSICANGITKYNSFSAAFGFVAPNIINPTLDFFVVDDQVCYAPLTEGYREYVAMMAQWYSEGLIDPDFPSLITVDDVFALMSSNDCAATSDHGGILDYYSVLGSATNPDVSYIAAPMPVKEVGDQLHVNGSSGRIISKSCAISTSCQNPEIAVKYLDQFYTDEGFALLNFGTEGKTYTLVDGLPEYTELVTNNPQGSMICALSAYALPGNYFGEYVMGRDTSEETRAMAALWNANSDTEYLLPQTMTLNKDEKEVYSEYFADIKSYTEEMTVKFIMNLEPMDQYDQFIAQLKGLNIDEVLEAYQSAYDRYMSR